MDFQTKISYTFKCQKLLESALTHPSMLRGRKFYDFERLEFLGDRVLGLVMAEWVYKNYPKQKEGLLAQRLATLVSREMCAQIAKDIELEKDVRVNYKDCQSQNTSVLSNAVEALLGAIYLDGGLEPCQTFIHNFWEKYMKESAAKDSKSYVQEWAQKKQLPTPSYNITNKEGPEHSPSFTLELFISDKLKTVGYGPSRKQAEHDAAQKFIHTFIQK